MREGPNGFVMVGEHVLDVAVPDAAALEAEMDAADEHERRFYQEAGVPSPWTDTQYRCAMLYYRCFDSPRRRRIPCERDSGQFGGAFSAASLDGDKLPWMVARMQQLR